VPQKDPPGLCFLLRSQMLFSMMTICSEKRPCIQLLINGVHSVKPKTNYFSNCLIYRISDSSFYTELV